MIVAIYAYEGMYGGLHGMNAHAVVEVDSIKEARELACDMSRDVMEDYDEIMDEFYASAEGAGIEEDTYQFYDYIVDCINDNIDYNIWEVDRPYDLEQMEKDFYNDMDDFIKNHCKEVDE